MDLPICVSKKLKSSPKIRNEKLFLEICLQKARNRLQKMLSKNAKPVSKKAEVASKIICWYVSP